MPDREKEHPDGSELREQAEAAFVEFMSLTHGGDEPDFEAFCADRPQLADGLRELHSDWKRIHKLVGRTMPLSLSGELSQVHGIQVDEGVTLDPVQRPTGAVLERLGEHTPQGTRYEVLDEIARGGMGVILRIWDQDLRRNLAMKALIPEHDQHKAKDRTLARFLEEAQITGQLGHPGIVPVHDLGLDPRGRVFFTMPLVHGRDFKDVITLTRHGREGWTQTRALRVILKVCEAVAYAHSRDVIHRDLKPANVMVGAFGETYVMDWGLARVMGRADKHDIRIRPDGSTGSVETELRDAQGGTEASPLFTMDGAVVGTPSYMSPEQARAQIEELDGRADVYSIGAMLYHLLSHHMPYCPKGVFISPRTVLMARLNGPPTPIADLNPEAPRELVEICEKAMADAREDRYATPLELAADIERYLTDRPVSAHESKLGYQLALAYRRNRAFVNAVAVAAAVLLAFAGLFFFERQKAQQRAYDVMSARALPVQADELFPALPRSIPALAGWIRQVDDLLGRESRWRTEPEDGPEAAGVLASMDRLKERRVAVAARLDLARRLEDPSYLGRDRLWADASEEIAASPHYGGLRLVPHEALVPLGANPVTGLWEFWSAVSGERPERDPASGAFAHSEEDAVVLVLLPGGPCTVGSPPEEVGRDTNEEQREVHLEPFFMAKFEVTQAQWARVMRENPSAYPAGLVLPKAVSPHHPDQTITALHPVENISWHSAAALASRLGLQLPGEDQWEYAARAGALTAWSCGATVESLEGRANLVDKAAERFGSEVAWDDGYAVHAPIGSFAPNAFGLYDAIGNVSEWCSSWYDSDWTGTEKRRIYRGGSFAHGPAWLRSAFRVFDSPDAINLSRGTRLAAPIRRETE